MTASSTNDQVLTLRKTGGYAIVENLGLIEVSGIDAGKFLQFRTTNDVLSLKPGQGQINSLLDRTAHLQGIVSVYRRDSSFWLLVERPNVDHLIAQMEQYHFAEKIEIANLSATGSFLAVQGPNSFRYLSKLDAAAQMQLSTDNSICNSKNLGVAVVRKSITGEDGFLFWIPAAESSIASKLQQSAADLGFCTLSPESLNVARIEAGIPCYGIDMSADDLLPDTGLEESTVSYTKGCYLGQEVIARIKTYSAPRKGLVGLAFTADSQLGFELNSPIYLDNKEIGSIKSNVYSPTLKQTLALAYLTREYRVPDQQLSLRIGDKTQSTTVRLLPFYKSASRRQRAQELYNKGLADFAADKNDDAIASLREALELDPACPDFYETLGVILSKLDELEEAVSLMQHLAEIDPQSVMAHTNLSVFYMQQGNKEAAEEEKAIAMSMQMQKLAEEFKTQQKDAEDKQHKRDEAVQRIEMFKEVLAIDKEDQLANYGIGNLYVEIEEFSQAIPHLQKAVALKPDHTAAYLALGSALSGAGNTAQAIDVFQRGVAVAARRGDMTPLKTMQQHLEQLKSKPVVS